MATSLRSEPIRLPVARHDLSFVSQRSQATRYWTVKDPVRLRYFQLREEEYFILQRLDGQHTLDDIVSQFDKRFAPRRLRRTELSSFIAMLHREGLTIASAYGQGEHLLARRMQRQRRQWLGRLTNILAIKLPGVSSDRWLSAVVPRVQWLFSPLLVVSVALLMIAAGVLITIDMHAVLARLPKFHELIGPNNFISMVVALTIVKSLHELGHAVTCQHFGGRCHRIGVMLLLFTPALYCDVSDAWMFTQRWKRIAVSAAGIIVELVLAALALVLWSTTEPGWLNTLLLNIVFVCSIGTLFINGNPLLRYDGYFILSDLLNAPNLYEQAQSLLKRWCALVFTGIELAPPPTLAPPSNKLLAVYGLLSLGYRWLMICGVLWLIHTALAPLGLAVAAQAVTVLVLASQIMLPLYHAFRFLSEAMQRNQLHWPRLAISGGLAGVTLFVVAAIPLPRRVTAPLVVEPAGARQIYVTTPGVLRSAISSDSSVKQGQEIARLTNTKLELELAELRSQVQEQQLVVRHAQLLHTNDRAAADGLPVAMQMLSDLQTRLAHKQREHDQLTLLAPQAGQLLLTTRQTEPAHDELPTYSGSPLDAVNLGCYLPTGTLLCSIGQPDHVEALVLIPESDAPLVTVGQRARLIVDELPGQVLTGEVAAISSRKAQRLPPLLLASGVMPVEHDAQGQWQPQHNYFEATIKLDPLSVPLQSGGLGTAKIQVASESLFTRGYRALRGTFRLPF